MFHFHQAVLKAFGVEVLVPHSLAVLRDRKGVCIFHGKPSANCGYCDALFHPPAAAMPPSPAAVAAVGAVPAAAMPPLPAAAAMPPLPAAAAGAVAAAAPQQKVGRPRKKFCAAKASHSRPVRAKKVPAQYTDTNPGTITGPKASGSAKERKGEERMREERKCEDLPAAAASSTTVVGVVADVASSTDEFAHYMYKYNRDLNRALQLSMEEQQQRETPTRSSDPPAGLKTTGLPEEEMIW